MTGCKPAPSPSDTGLQPGAASPSPQENFRLRAAEVHRQAVKRAGLILIDLDGCLAFENRPHPAAREFLGRYDGRCAILSNNSSETPESLARLLASEGLAIDPSRILLAGSLMIDLLAAEHRHSRICLLASRTIRNYAAIRGLDLSLEDGAIVALARDTSLSYRRLARAVSCLCRGAELIVSNTDLTHPGRQQLPVPETGAILKLIRACVPLPPFTVVGKPSRRMFEIALNRFGGDPTSTVMIGDNPSTDGAGARSAGITPILVGPTHPHSSIATLL